MSKVYLPLEMTSICGHDLPLSLMGREESSFYNKIDNTEYIGRLEEGPCEICNKRAKRRLKDKARRMHKKEFA